MKYWFLVGILIICGHHASSQNANEVLNARISVDVNQGMANQILTEVGDKIGYSITYNADFLNNRIVQISSDSASVYEILTIIFESKKLQISIIGNQLVVHEKIGFTFLEDSCHRVFTGRLYDVLTGKPVPRATINELRSGQMTVSNGDGKFVINMPCQNDDLLIEIDAMGFHSKQVDLKMDEELGDVGLEGDYITLQEVIILSVPAEQLIKSVLKKIPINYLQKPTNASAFFREAVLKNGQVVTLSEAVFGVYNTPYTTSSRNDQVQLLKGRKFTDPIYIDTVDFKIKGSLRSCFELDVVKNRPGFLDQNQFNKHYTYSFKNVVEFGGNPIYVIEFKRKEYADGFPYEGILYIDRTTLAIRAVEFELSRKMLKGKEDRFVVKRGKGTKTRFQRAQYYINYTMVDGQLAMNYVSLKTEFKVRKKKNLFYADYETLSEYVVNRFKTEDVNKIRSRDVFTSGKVFMDQPMAFDKEYWEGVNYLPIDQPLLESSELLKKILIE